MHKYFTVILVITFSHLRVILASAWVRQSPNSGTDALRATPLFLLSACDAKITIP